MSMIPGGGQAINEDDVKASDYEVIPPCRDVKMHWVEAEVKYKDDDPSYARVNATAEILDGPHAGRRIWEGWTLAGNGVKTEVANKIFDQVCFALNYPARINSPEELLNKPFLGDIKVNKGQNGYSDKNGLAQYKKFDPLAQKPAASGGQSGGAAWRRS